VQNYPDKDGKHKESSWETSFKITQNNNTQLGARTWRQELLKVGLVKFYQLVQQTWMEVSKGISISTVVHSHRH
jgi:hypothetical protein